MGARLSMTPARRKRILAAHGNRCAIPGCAMPEPYEIDHKQALARGGKDSDDNLWPLCKQHHKEKTFGAWGRKLGADLFEIAKTKRLKRKQGPKVSKRAIQSRGFDTRYRKKMNGKVELKASEKRDADA